MALILIDPLTPDKRSVSLPETITFRAALQDIEATSQAPINHTMQLTLEDGTDLSFGQGGKSASSTGAIGPDRTPISVTLTVSGSGAGLLSFKVTLRDDAGQELGACLINLL